jgi:hypothetical protein
LKDWGMAVTVTQVPNPGDADDESNGLISWNVTWEDNSKQWLTAVGDVDNGFMFDWIRSGRNGASAGADRNDAAHDYLNNLNASMDQFEVYEKIWDGRIAPYRLAARNIWGANPSEPLPPAYGRNQIIQGIGFEDSLKTARNGDYATLKNLSSVDLVITPDKSMWSQVLVLELGEEAGLNEGGAKKFEIRKHASLDINGNEVAGEQGRTWFPGYAINLETGERLNIILGEDSYQAKNNGRDLKWNPNDAAGGYGTGGYVGWGGRHFIYIMDTDTNYIKAYPKGVRYDGCQDYMNRLAANGRKLYFRTLNNEVMYHAMWAIPTYMSNGYTMTYDEGGMPIPPSRVEFNLRVKKPYRYFVTGPTTTNSYNPKYSFTTEDVYTEKNIAIGKKALDDVRLVPNPYFAYSAYENNPVENKVKITNLPRTCNISIYTVDGSLVQRIIKDDESTEITWDLKNSARVPIGSGNYIIHVDAGELGETIIKFMGIMRELDLDSF